MDAGRPKRRPAFRRLDGRILARNVVPPLQTWIKQGHAVSLLEQLVVEHGVDLLVLGSRGRTALSNMLGGTTTRILQTLRCDALLVPGDFRVRS